MKSKILLIGMLITGTILSAQIKAPVLTGQEKLSMYQNHEEMRDQSPYKELHWQFIGPTNISGRCTDVEAVGSQGPKLYHLGGCCIRGVWKSINEGTTFEPVFEHQGTSTIGDLAVSPPPIRKSVWVGNRRSQHFQIFQPGLRGLENHGRRRKAGPTWAWKRPLPYPGILVHPDNPDIVYVAASGS
jgi:hypothetical protein